MSLSSNQFAQSPVKGQLDAQINSQVLPCEVGSAQATSLIAGQAVTMVDSAGGPPKVIAAANDTDDIFGFVNYSIKDQGFAAGAPLGISQFRGNVMYMEASAAIARNAKVMVVISGSKVATATSGKTIIGRALDKAAASGDLIRVIIDLPGAAL